MRYEVVMPQLGQSMTEGSVIRWLKLPGDRVEKGDCLFEVQTDKVDMEVESLESGFLEEILVEPGKLVPVGTVIATISATKPSPGVVWAAEVAREVSGEEEPSPVGADAKSVKRAAAEPAIPAPEARAAISEARTEGAHKLVSPRAKKLARHLGVDLSLVEASSASGRVTEADVQRYIQQTGRSLAQPASAERDYVLEIPSVARKTIAARMAGSFQTVPHFYLSVVADATELKKVREDLLGVVDSRHGVRLTYTDLLIKSLALALVENPGLNVSWQDEKLVRRKRVHIGFAVQAQDTLLVPVIRDADRVPLIELARIRHGLVEKSRAGALSLSELEDASCTLSNLGAFGVDQFNAIINPPQSTILAAGRIALRPAVSGETVVARLTIPLTLSVDHRVVDGVGGALFLQSIVKVLESPYRLLL